MSRVLVYGASGLRGQAIVKAVQAGGHVVRAFVNEAGVGLPSQVDAFVGDLRDRDSVRRATAGVDSVILQLPVSLNDESAGRAAIDEAHAAGAAVTFLAHAPTHDTAVGYAAPDTMRAVAAYARAAGGVTIAMPLFLENIAAPWSVPAIVRDGVLAYPLPAGTPVAWVAADDVARALAATIGRTDLAGQQLIAAGPRKLTGNELAAILAEELGRSVAYVPVPPGEFETGLRPMLGDGAAKDIGDVYRFLATPAGARHLAIDSAGSAATLGITFTDQAEWARRVAWHVLAAQSAV